MRSLAWPVALALLSACGDNAPGAGTLVYIEPSTQHVRLFDVASGGSWEIDGGMFSNVSIAPDGQHVAYSDTSNVFRVADRSGNITILSVPGGSCGSTAQWAANHVLTYCSVDTQNAGTVLLPGLGSMPRYVESYGLAVSHDGALDAYVSTKGDLVIEHVDGSQSRVLIPSANPDAAVPTIAVDGFTPDDRALLVSDSNLPGLRIVAVANGSSVAVPGVYSGGYSPLGPVQFYGASAFSPDGSEVLADSASALVALSLADGTQRTIAPFQPRFSSAGAVFLDPDHVLWVRSEDRSQGDLGAFVLSLHVTGPDGADVLLDDPQQVNELWPSIAVLPDGLVALPSDLLLVRLDGTVIARNNNPRDGAAVIDLLGLSPGGSAITLSYNGEVSVLAADGSRRGLVRTAGRESFGPSAAYASE